LEASGLSLIGQRGAPIDWRLRAPAAPTAPTAPPALEQVDEASSLIPCPLEQDGLDPYAAPLPPAITGWGAFHNLA